MHKTGHPCGLLTFQRMACIGSFVVHVIWLSFLHCIAVTPSEVASEPKVKFALLLSRHDIKDPETLKAGWHKEQGGVMGCFPARSRPARTEWLMLARAPLGGVTRNFCFP